MALRLIKRVLRKLSADDVLYVMPAVTSLVSTPAEQCRAEVYDILMLAYDVYRCVR